MQILAIDPGQNGAFVLFDGEKFDFRLMPILVNKDIDFEGVQKILMSPGVDKAHVFLERAMPMAQGARHAFNYGRGFAALEIAIKLANLPVTYVEPAKWSKIMHEGISADLKPKAKSIIAVQRLFPQFIEKIPKTKTLKYHEGVIDALLIAGYGLRN